MFWLLRAARRLKQLGIMGMNQRNAAMILDHNPRSKFPLVDDKLRMRDLCAKIGVPSPAVYAAVSSYAQLRHLDKLLGNRDDFVFKPNNGSGGRGILVITGRKGDHFFARGPGVSHAYVRLESIGEPVRVGGLTVRTGDLVHADQHGVLLIPRPIAAELPAAADRIIEREQEFIRWVRSAEFDPDRLAEMRRVRH